MTTSQEEAERAGAFSSMLAFRDHKKRSAGGSIERVVLNAVNGNSFKMNQTIDIVIPGNTQGFADMHNSYLRLKINYDRKSTSGAHDLSLPTNGVYNLFKRVELIASGTVISSIDEYAKLVNLMLDTDMDSQKRVSAGNIQYGMGESSSNLADNVGVGLDGGSGGAVQIHSTQFCFLPILSVLASLTKYLPLMGDELRLRLTLNDFDSAFISGNRGSVAGVAVDPTTTPTVQTVVAVNETNWAGDPNNITISPVELIMYKVSLDDLPLALVQQNTGGVYSMVLTDYTNSKGSVATADTTSVFNTGFSFTSCARILFAFYPQYDNDARKQKADSERHKVTRNVNTYCFNVGGKNIPALKLSGRASETLTENKASLRILGDFQHRSSINNENFNIPNWSSSDVTKDGKTFNGIGTRHYEVDLETLKNYSDENGLYSGISTTGKTTAIHVDYTGGGVTATEMNAWAEHQIGFTLDMNGSRTWKVVV